MNPFRRTRTIHAPTTHCQFCGTTGLGHVGWTSTCPDCQTSPARQAWHGEAVAIANAARAQAAARGLPGRLVITPEITARATTLGSRPA